MRCFIAAASFFATVFFIGCGAPTGTGLDSKPNVDTNKILQVEEVLAVDDILVNSTLNIGTGIENGVITGLLDVGTLVTNAEGKISPFSVSISTQTSYLFFQISGGQNGLGGPDLADDSRFFGVLDLDTESTNQVQDRININPLSSIVSYAKAQSPLRKVADLTLSAISPFFTATATAGIDVNSSKYAGKTSDEIESNGDGILFQIMNEMIRTASADQVGANEADKIANFCRQMEQEVSSGQDVFTGQGNVFQKLSSVAQALSTSSTVLGEFYSKAITSLSTSDASFKPAAFSSGVEESSNLQIGSQVLLDNYSVEISTVSSGKAIITSSEGAGIVLSSIPSKVRFDLSQNLFQAPSQGVLSVKVQRALDDIIEATVNPVKIDSRSPFKMIFPQGALITGVRKSPDGSVLNVTTINQSEDSFISSTGYMEIPLGDLIEKGEAASGVAFPDSVNQELSIEVRLQDIQEIKVLGFPSLVDTFEIPYLQIVP